ncbi:serine serine/threonine-protein kinase haspin [Solea senegalensis]|uniref:Serine/threonine-protein kinase haspin n=2 Tax=Solea senegalensis TaxID=28829 RepID=A0AAV6Q7A6_SOLSE|nr:uncharacterized protein haspin isoform X1 [Solea senegalensis]KAG7485277.1 serine serine/threonine-protein kinase haspin [Solea senegalensis]
MKPVNSVFLKTYGKQRRKLPAWISPDNRKQVFDSSVSTDGDLSEFEPSKPGIRGKKTSVARRNGTRPAKIKAIWCLTEENSCEEDGAIPSLPHPQQSRTIRLKKTSVCNSRAVRPAKRKAALRVMENNSDEENISCSLPAVAQQSNRTSRRNQLASNLGVLMKRKGRQVPVTSESEGDSVARSHKNSVQKKSGSDVQRSVGRFVTCRTRRAAAKPTLPKAIVSNLNSSDDFTTEALRSRRILRPTRRTRVPPSAFLVSSAENSINAVGTLSFANPLREISLNESADHSLGLYSRNPPFCSTPSASSFSTRPRLKPFSINEKSTSIPSMTVGCAGILSPFQENLKSPGQPVSPPLSAAPTGLYSDDKLQPSLCEQSGDLFMEYRSTNKRRSCSQEANSHTEDSKAKFRGELSLNLLSVDSESSSDFVSAAGGLEWLIEALKEKCLTSPCTVRLQRLENLTVTQLSCQTTYSSCLGLSSMGHSQQTHKPPQSVDCSQTASFNLHSLITRSCSRSVDSCDSLEQAASGTDLSPLVDCKNFADESTHHAESSVDFIMGTHLSAKSVETLFTEDEALAVNDKRLVKKCTVQLKRLDLSQLTVQQLKGFTKQKETHLVCSHRSVNAENDHTRNTNDPEDLTCLGETMEGSILPVRRSVSNYGPVAQTQSSDPATEEKAAILTTTLRERCHSRKLFVEIKRISLPQSKGDKGQRSPTDASGSASHEQIKNNHQSDSDMNVCREDTSLKVNRKKRSLTSEDSISSNEEVVKSSCDILPRGKKMSLVPKEKKRRSTSTDRPGTTRKACVSGLSVNRWKNKSNTSAWLRAGEVKSVDCSINELITAKHKQPKELQGFVNLSTPVRASPLNISSLLADFTPNTHTWRRLKAALSVHRKVLLTPRSVYHQGTPGRTAQTDISQDLFASPLRSLLPKHLQLQLTHNSSLCEDAELSDAEKVYAECGQEQPLAWEECILPHRMKRCVKIGEGTFGEVFSTTNASGETVALKIIPLEGSEKVNGEDQKTFGEILHEIIISKELSSLKEKQHNQTHSFIGLNDLHCVRGRYPPEFLSAWDKFDQKKGSENDRPDFFEEDQFFLILEFEFGGADLENSNGTLASLGVAKSILHQVTAALAVAEQELHFEHRDLHWGNVLVKTTKQKTGSFLLNGTTHSVETKGLLVRIIDYSLSRLEIDDLTVSCDISKDEELFMGQGDYQFDIYRLMRQENGNEWSVYRPHTNVLWLHYLCSKLLSMKYRGSGGRGAKDTREELTRFYDNVLQYGSATEALQNCPMFQ